MDPRPQTPTVPRARATFKDFAVKGGLARFAWLMAREEPGVSVDAWFGVRDDALIEPDTSSQEPPSSSSAIARRVGSAYKHGGAKFRERVWAAFRELISCLRDLRDEAGALVPNSGRTPETPEEIAREAIREFDAQEPSLSTDPASGTGTLLAEGESGTSSEIAGVSESDRIAKQAAAAALIASTKEREEKAQGAIELALRASARRERFLYTTLVVVAVIAAVLAVVAAALLIEGHGSSAVASAAIALLPGVGTLLLRRLRRDERDRMEQLEDGRRKHAAALQAIEFALSLDEPQRASEIGSLIAEMRRVAYS
jgi:hypothetical protein